MTCTGSFITARLRWSLSSVAGGSQPYMFGIPPAIGTMQQI